MEIELPTYGCNIISSSTTFYNYSNNNRTRETYIIYSDKAILQSTQTNNTGYNYTGTCLVTGDLVYKPEIQVYFPFMATSIIILICYIIYSIILKRFLR